MAGENDTWEIYKDEKGLFRWKRIARNGKIVAQSDKAFPYKDNCEENAARAGYKK